MKKILIAMTLLIATIMISVFVVGGMNIIPKIAPKVDFEPNIGEEFDFDSKYINVLGSQMHYVDVGTQGSGGKTVLLVHGNPTSSYLWRNIIPKIGENNRVIALDLIGMGKSDKPHLEYTLQDHTKYFDQFVENLGLTNIILVLHDWGGAIGLNYNASHTDNVEGLIIMEAVIKPNYWKNADVIGEYIFRNLRDDKKGYQLIVKENYFLEKLLPMMSGRELTTTEMNYYKQPYLNETSRKLISVWPKEIPIDEIPKRNHLLVGNNYNFLKNSNKPVMFLHGEPSVIFNNQLLKKLRQDFPKAEINSVGPGMHYLQETQPTNISKLILKFIEQQSQ